MEGLQANLSEYGVPIFDPTTGDPVTGAGRSAFAGAGILASRISPQAVALLSQLPAPNIPGGAIENNFAAGGAETFDDDAFNIRGDYKATGNLNMFGRYSWADFEKSAPGVFGPL